jgi:hypothetical protein
LQGNFVEYYATSIRAPVIIARLDARIEITIT